MKLKIFKVLLILVIILLSGCSFLFHQLYPTSQIELKNLTILDITKLYITAQNDNEWGTDLLGARLPAGQSILIKGLPRALSKAKIVLENQEELYRDNLDLESFDSLVINITYK